MKPDTPQSDGLIEKLDALHAKATPGPFEYRIGDDLNGHRQVPCVMGAGLVGRSCIARHADDYEGHADAELHAALRNAWPILRERLERAEKDAERYQKIKALCEWRTLGKARWLQLPQIQIADGERGGWSFDELDAAIDATKEPKQ